LAPLGCLALPAPASAKRRPPSWHRRHTPWHRPRYPASTASGCLRMTYAAAAPAPNSARKDTPVASQVVPSHWAPK
jgi:hypothetical protein